MTRLHAMTVTGTVLAGLAFPLCIVGPASAAPSEWTYAHEEGTDVVNDLCDVPGLNVLTGFAADSRWRFTARGPDGLPLREEHADEHWFYTNLASGESVTGLDQRSEHPLQVTDNGDGTLTYLYRHTDNEVMYGQDGKVIARLRTGSIVIQKTFSDGGTPTDPSDDEGIGFDFPNGFDSTGRNADFCTALVQAIG